jgi:hypothetical protein
VPAPVPYRGGKQTVGAGAVGAAFCNPLYVLCMNSATAGSLQPVTEAQPSLRASGADSLARRFFDLSRGRVSLVGV